MRYIEASFFIADDELQEVLVSLLDPLGFEGFEMTDDCLKAYIPMPDYEQLVTDKTFEEIPLLGGVTIETQIIEETNWNEVWESGFNPVFINGQVQIRASFHPVDESMNYDLLIDPKMSFGTGHHETTSMMVETMLGDDYTDKNVLDFGSGTGILAILAAKMGARSVVAIDHEHWAYENALENVEQNQVSGVTVLEGDQSVIPNDSYHIILANVNKNVIFQSLEQLLQHLLPDGYIYLSGLLHTDREATLELTEKLGLQLVSELAQGQWICLKLKK